MLVRQKLGLPIHFALFDDYYYHPIQIVEIAIFDHSFNLELQNDYLFVLLYVNNRIA